MLEAPNKLGVLVANSDGEPVSNAAVKLETHERTVRTTTGPTGRARIEVPSEGVQAKLQINHPNYETVRQPLNLKGGQNIDVSLSQADIDNTTSGEPSDSADEDDSNLSKSSHVDTLPSKDELLKELIDLDDQSTRRVRRGEMRAIGEYDPEHYEAVFGTWSEAIEAMNSLLAGEEISSQANQKQYSKEDVLDAISDVEKQVVGRPSTTDMNELSNISAVTVYRYFDSWDDAVSAALGKNTDGSSDGFEDASVDTSVQQSTDEVEGLADDDKEPSENDLLEEINHLRDELDRVPSKNEMSKRGQYSPRDYEKVFDTWSEAIRAAGFEPRGSHNKAYSRDEVISALRDIASNQERPPTVDDINENAPMSASVIYNYFDSITEARKAAAVVDTGSSPPTSVNERSNMDSTDKKGASDTQPTEGTSQDIGIEHQDDPLANGIEEAPDGRLSGVVVEVINVTEPNKSRRTAIVSLRTSGGEEVSLDVWEKHDVEWTFEAGDILLLDEVSLKRWSSHLQELSTTRDFSASKIKEDRDTESKGGEDEENREKEDTDDGFKNAVDRIVGLGGATEKDAAVLIEAGYTSPSELEAASLEQLRTLSELDDGVALRIKAELG